MYCDLRFMDYVLWIMDSAVFSEDGGMMLKSESLFCFLHRLVCAGYFSPPGWAFLSVEHAPGDSVRITSWGQLSGDSFCHLSFRTLWVHLDRLRPLWVHLGLPNIVM